MKIKILLTSALFMIMMVAAKSDKPAYIIYNQKGKKVDYSDLLKAAEKSDIVVFGELHDNPICHWLELELTKDLWDIKKENLVLGAEMFERDNQQLLNEYIHKFIRKKDFEAEAKLWKNYKTDYAPIVDFASDKNIRFIATNVPRRFAAVVNQYGFEGLDSINALQRGMIASLPIKFNPDLKCYKDMLSMQGEGMPGHSSPNIAKAQALKDATMAASILKNGADGQLFLHFNGSYHSDNFEGLVWYLNQGAKRMSEPLKILTISTVEQDTIDDLKSENTGKADFIICIPSSMIKSY